MPELPEVECLVRAVRQVLEGQHIDRADFHRSDLRWPIPIDDFKQRMVGQTILKVLRRSKYLLLQTQKGYGIFHLGMSGNVLLSDRAESNWKHTHASFKISGDGDRAPQYLHFVDPRRFGCILSCSAEDLEQHSLFRSLGPEPLEDDTLAQHLAERAYGKTVAVKNFIMDAHQVVGVGNIYASEALFRSSIRPTRRTGSLRVHEWEKLAQSIREVLLAAIEAGGTSFRDYKHVDGEAGYFEVALAVYGRKGEACRSCSTPIRLIKIGGRASYFCPLCQPSRPQS